MIERNRSVAIALIQTAATADIHQNMERTGEKIRLAASQGAQIVCTQELFKSEYFCQCEDPKYFQLAEEVDRNSQAVIELSDLAAELNIVLIASLFERRAVGLYHNTAIVLDADGSYLGKYRKMHIPDDPRYYEKYYFTPGDLGFKTFKTRYAKIGVLICWDQWFPEAARLTAMNGAEIIFFPTAIGFSKTDKAPGYNHAWEIVQRGHAVANACYVAVVNRTGFEADPTGGGGIQFWGGSFIANPYGRIVAKAGTDEEEVLVCNLDLEFIRQVRDESSFPFRDRRIDHYHNLTKLYGDE